MNSPRGIDELPWAEVAPAGHAAVTDDDVRAALAACAFDTHYLVSLEARLAQAHGDWSVGWRECLPSAPALEYATHALLRAHREPRRDERLPVDPARRPAFDDAIVATVLAWQTWLDDIAREFAALASVDPGSTLADHVSRAAIEIITGVVAITTYDAWYRLATLKLRWYLEYRAVPTQQAAQLVERFVEGRFESWVAPDPAQIVWVAGELATGLAATRPRRGQLTDQGVNAAVPDALQAWLAVRATTPWATLEPARDPTTLPRVTRDDMVDFIEDRARTRPDWSSGMRVALAACRAEVAAGQAIDLDTLVRWNSLALGRPAQLRATDAFAHEGRERYGTWPGLHASFAAALAEANAPDVPALARAARAYLDVLFFHPFVDGNARTAGLLVDAVLRRADLALQQAWPLLTITRRGGEPSGGVLLVRMLSGLVGRAPAP